MSLCKRFALLGVLAALVLLSSVPVQAGSIGFLDIGVINEWEDRDWEVAFNDDAGTIVPGTLFLGTLRIEAWGAPPPGFPSTYLPGGGDPTISGIFAIKAASVVTDAGRTAVYFEPLGTTDWSDVFDDYVPGLTLPSPVDANTMFIAYDDVLRGVANADDPLLSLQDAIDNFVGANKVYEFGFEGSKQTDADGRVTTDQGEFWVAEGPEGSDVIGTFLDELQNIININALVVDGGAPPLAPHDFLLGQATENAAQRAGVTFANKADLQARGDVDLTDAAGALPIRTNTTLYIYPIPEPSSIVLWGVGAVALGLAAARRRKRTLAA